MSATKTSLSASPSPQAQQAMDTLTAQWYNAITSGCGLDPNSFQLIQGNTPLGTTSESLWNMFDAIPPLSLTNYFNPSQFNNFSTDYGAIINHLITQNANSFINDMGDYYSLWESYLNSTPAPTMPSGGILQLFANWSQLHMPPDQAQACYTDYQQVSQGVVPVATQMWLNAGGGTGGTKAYNNTIASLQNMLKTVINKTVTLDSATESSDVTHTWAKAEVGGFYDIFWGEGSGGYDDYTTTLTGAGLNLSVTFNSLVTFTAGPLAKPSQDPILSQYLPWYNSDALGLAYNHPNDNTVWKTGSPNWDNAFGPNGNMQRVAVSLVVVDGITITIKSSASFATSDQKTITAAVSGGVFPFFAADASGGWDNQASFGDKGGITITSICPKGNPNILGVLVTPIQQTLGGQ